MSLFFLEMTALRCIKVPEWQEENLAADGKNRHYIRARKNYSQGAAPRAVIFQRKKDVPCRQAGGRQAVYAEDDGEEGFRGMGNISSEKGII